MTGPGQLLRLRDYQQETIDAIYGEWKKGILRPAVVLPTGAGKTVVFAHLVKRFLTENPNKRVLILAHTDELVDQAAKKIKEVAPHLPVGIVKGPRNDVWAPVIVASVQSLRREERRRQILDVGLIIVDECHHATAKTYINVLTHFGAFGPTSESFMDYGALGRDFFTYTVGFTATLARGDGAKLNEIWQSVAISRDILFMIERGYLLDIEGVSVEVPDLDLSSVKRSGGDFQDGDLGRAMTESLAPELIADAYVKYAKDRAGLAFWPTVEAAYVGAGAMNERGIVTEVVHGALKMDERRSILERFRLGEIQVVSNCMVLTEGFDAPWADVAALARPTRSKPLFQQIVGRILRPHPGQTKALLIDAAGAGANNDLRTLIDLTDKPVVIRPGQSLAEAAAAMNEKVEVAPYRGPVTFAAFDPLKRAESSKRAWMQTKGGTHFLAWGEKRYLFLVPSTLPDVDPGKWDVAWCTKMNVAYPTPNGPRFGDFTEHRGMSMEYAMNWAETIVNELSDNDTDFGNKNAPWRKRPAGEKQLRYARRLGCDVSEGMTGHEVSLAIDTAIATPRVDYYVGQILKMAEAK